MILSKLDVMIRLQAVSVVEGKPLRQQVALLSLAGLQPKQIAEVLSKSPNHISVLLHELRKEKRTGSDSEVSQESRDGREVASV